jgi:hypothetical protein
MCLPTGGKARRQHAACFWSAANFGGFIILTGVGDITHKSKPFFGGTWNVARRTCFGVACAGVLGGRHSLYPSFMTLALIQL